MTPPPTPIFTIFLLSLELSECLLVLNNYRSIQPFTVRWMRRQDRNVSLYSYSAVSVLMNNPRRKYNQ